MNGRTDDPGEATGPAADRAPKTLADIPIDDRWAPLVKGTSEQSPRPAKMGQRVLTSALCLIVLALALWALG